MALSLVATVGSAISDGGGVIAVGYPTVFVGAGISIAAVGVADTSLHKHWHQECGSNGCFRPHSSAPSVGSKTVFVGELLPIHRIGDSRACISDDSTFPPVGISITNTSTTTNVFCGD
mgnify:CR=1 FL=1|tara:strand:- start:130 stop:483 length:354 start_codon:yes stop_codon:yes gene_type:complete